jgi:predicted transcriptional regulator
MPRGGKRSGAGAPRMPAEMKQQITSFALSPRTLELLNRQARAEGKSRSQIADMAIFQYLSRKLRKREEKSDAGINQG